MKWSSFLLSLAVIAIGCAPETGVLIESDEGPVAPDLAPPITRIAFGSCAFQWVEQPIFRAVVAAEPDLYLSLGDAIYGDFDGENTFDVTPESLREEWQELADNPDWQHLTANVPVMAVWDNHDYGKADKGPPMLAEREEGAGGSLGKYAPQTDPGVSLLGAAQWTWLEDQLRHPAEVRLIASSGQIVPDQKGMDEWGIYPHERQRLFDVVESTGAEGVVLLTGNVHFSELSKTDEGSYPLYGFTSSGLTHVNEEYPQAPNDYRVAGPYVDLNFGLVEIDWEAPSPRITLQIIDVEGNVQLEHELHLKELRDQG